MRLPAAEPDRAGFHPALRDLKITWFGHATLLVVSPGGVRVLVDPFLTSNPSCPPASKRGIGADIMLVTHGHADHCEDAATIARERGATVVASPELASWIERQGAKHLRPMNIGGRLTLSGLQIAMVPAVHSSSAPDGTYLGPATGFVVRFENNVAVYFAGDTALFGDMRLIRDRYAPELAFLPIGDRFTMGPEDAATAAEWLGVKAAVPIHYGTFPELTGTPAEFRRYCSPKGIDVIELRPGETVG
jgi:L-ascorbate metabolism protein UlaG (beta-lactamase superfamily)